MVEVAEGAALETPPLDTAPDDVEQAGDPAHGDGDNGAADMQALVEEIRRDPLKAARHVKALRAEAASRRKQAETLQTERQADATTWEARAQAYETSVAALEPRARRADAVDAYLAASVGARVEGLPPQYRALVPQYDDPLKTLQWLDDNAAVLALPRAPATDTGTRGEVNHNGDRAHGSAEQLQAARERYRLGR